MASGRGTRKRVKSSPSIWTKQGGIRIEPMWSRTGYGEVVHYTWGSPPVLSFQLPEMITIRADEENPKQIEGQRVADSRVVLMKSEPMKPGNSVEDKTLMTGAIYSG
jgi:hypothetical protein